MNGRAYISKDVKYTNDVPAPVQPKHTAISVSHICSTRGATAYVKQPGGLESL